MSEESAAPKRTFPVARLIGILLILIAVVWHCVTVTRKKADAEAAVQAAQDVVASVLQDGVVGIMVEHTLEGLDLPPILYPCGIDNATNLLHSLITVQPTLFPKDKIEGDLFVLHVVDTNKVVHKYRAIRPADTPSDALVGILTQKRDEESGKILEKVSAPALAVGAGDVLGGILKELVEKGTKAAQDPKFHESFENLLEKIAAERSAKAAEAGESAEPNKPAESDTAAPSETEAAPAEP